MVEKGGVPVAFEDATGHDEEFSAGVEDEGFHEAFADFAIDGGSDFFGSVVPGEFLPKLFSVSGGGISGAAHAGEVEGLVVGGEVEGEDAAGVVVALDDAPAGEVGRLNAGDFLAALFEIPEDDFAHEVAGGEEFAVVRERDRLDGWSVGEGMAEFAGGDVEDFDRGFGFGRGLVFVAAAEVLAGGGGNEGSVGRDAGLPGPEVVGFDLFCFLLLPGVDPFEVSVVAG